ncbi:ZIP zinc/iron transport family [Xylariaceae sp. FL1019]|nr:ZIP zinc/iron transport family [Xylariaceae sp. FL1019]
MSFASAALDAVLAVREEDSVPDLGPGYAVVVCDNGNDYDGRLGLRISSIFVIFIGSLLGAVVPILLARHSKMKVNGTAFFIAKYFGSGVIIATAFLHLLAPAFEALGSECLPDGPIKNYSWAPFIALLSVLSIFTVELIVSRLDVFGHGHDDSQGAHGPSSHERKGSPASTVADQQAHHGDIEANADGIAGGKERATNAEPKSGFQAPGLPNDVSYPPGGQDHFGHARDHEDDNSHTAISAQMTAIFILEFGVIFHSIFIGLTLAVAGSEFVILYIVLVFHQTFEGLGLGSRLATARWPRNKQWLPYVLGTSYALSTPISIAIGLGIRFALQPGSPNATLINGIFDSISAGILIYTGLVELLAHEFMFNTHMREAGLRTQLYALACVLLGVALMALLAIWA